MKMTENMLAQGDFKTERLLTYLAVNRPDHLSPAPDARPVIGVLKGTGIGPQVVDCTLQVLAAVQEVTGIKFDLWHGGPIGEEARTQFGRWLPNTVVQFCTEVFGRGGAILSGPGGGRYVYDLRKQFDLFCKFVPVQPWPELAGAGKLRHVRNIICEFHHHIDVDSDHLSTTLAILETAGFGYQIAAHLARPAGRKLYQDVIVYAYAKN